MRTQRHDGEKEWKSPQHLLKPTESVRIRNFAQAGTLYPIFDNYSNDLECTTNGVFQRIVLPNGPECEYQMNHNGYNECCKKGLGNVKMGRHVYLIYEGMLEESRRFWEQLKTDPFKVINSIYQRLRTQNISCQGASAVMGS